MKWFDDWFYNMCQAAWNRNNGTDDSANYSVGKLSVSNTKYTPSVEGQHVSFNLFKGQGGYVIQYQNSYSDFKNVDTTPKLVLVHRDDDLAKAIAHLITINSFSE